MHLAHVVATMVDGLYQEFLDLNFAFDNIFHCSNGRVHRPVAGCRGFELLTRDVQADACHVAYPDATHHLQVFNLDPGHASLFAHQHQYIVVGNIFLFVGQLQKVLVYFIQLLHLQLHTEHRQPVFQCRASTAGGEHDRVFVDSHVLRVDDLVGLHVLENPILVDPGRVRESISTHDRLVGLHRHVHEARHHSAGSVYMLRVDICIESAVLVAFECHHHLL